MNDIFRLALIWGAVCMPLVAAPALGEERQLVEGWGEIIDPDGDCRVAEDQGDVAITVPKTRHDLTYADKNAKLNAPRVLQSVEGDFTLEVTVRAFPLPGDAASSGGQYSFVSTGLLVWQDEKNFIRLERAAVGNSDAPFVWIEQFTEGQSAFQTLKPLGNKRDQPPSQCAPGINSHSSTKRMAKEMTGLRYAQGPSNCRPNST